mgnify:CR=1 FL=1
MKGEGTQLAWSDDDGETWNVVGNIYSINGGGVSMATVEMDHFLETPESAYTQLDAGVSTLEPITFEVRWKPDNADTYNHKATQDLLDSKTAVFWRIAYNDTDNNFGEIYHGLLTRFGEISIAPFEHLRAPMTITPTGLFYFRDEDVSTQEPTLS